MKAMYDFFTLRRLPLSVMAFVIASSLSPVAFGDAFDRMCNAEKCKVGTTATTYATKTEPYYGCPTRELSDYVNSVLSLVQATAQLTGNLPNISDKTGEPEFTGDTKKTIDGLRVKAQVTTYDQALALCQRGKAGRKAYIMNIPNDILLSVYVNDKKSGNNYWMPLSALDKRP